ncbi:MAG: multiple sugar transport system substrate-binding protein [Solirubrobacteraceae bacterium]|nr:multiple sugar transport system substrate-binding protein [Solirubrobacteraceae bacterium]
MASRRPHRAAGPPGWIALLTVALSLSGAICGSDGDRAAAPRAGDTITVWILENQPERVRATRRNVARFTERSGIGVRVVPIGDDELAARMERARATRRVPDVAQLPVASLHAYSRDGILDATAAADVIDRLGDRTFSQTALSLVSRDGQPAGVPSDGWGQLLIYRKDLFDRAGLPAPRTLEDISRAARRLDRGGMAGITLATAPADNFTAQTFEHVAMAAGCELVDDAGRVQLTSPRCRRAFRYYTGLARRYSAGGVQDVDSTRDRYFAGRAAMVFWSPFLLDAMAGLRDDAVPTCRECRRDRGYLARNSGLVGVLSSAAGGAGTQFGELSSWGIAPGDGARVDAAKRFVEYMLSDGYLRWLALSPQGKYPARPGDTSDPERYARGWARLQSGVDRTAPLRRFYSQAAIDALGEGVRRFQRWGFPQGQAALVGALRGPQPVTRALAAAVSGMAGPGAAARRAQAAVERIRAKVR